MRNRHKAAVSILTSVVFFVSCGAAYAQDISTLGEQSVQEMPVSAPGHITVDFKDADINTVLRILSLKSGINIVAGKDVSGAVSLRLIDVPWESALDTICATYDYSYERVGSVIILNSVRRMTEQKKAQKELYASQPMISEVFTLKYLNAYDVKKAIEPILTKGQGKAEVLYTTYPEGWGPGFEGTRRTSGAAGVGTTEAVGTSAATAGIPGQERIGQSKVLLVLDIPPVIERVRRTIASIDIKPRQVLIETRIIEVNRNKLRDLGLDVSTGTIDPVSLQLNPIKRRGSKATGYTTEQAFGANSLGSYASPAGFVPLSTDISGTPATGSDIFSTGLNLAYRKIMGFEFEVIIHALEEDVDANILSAPKLMTLNNQEASILIGSKYPILSGETSSTGGTATATAQLDYYQDVGIQLKVVPQINANGYINMVVHPVVSRITGYVSAGVIGTGTGAVPIQYPILETREAETQVLMQTGETVVIGGLLRDVDVDDDQGVPFLKDIPILGLPFSRRTTNKEKIDLLIFITARIVDDGNMSQWEKMKYDEFQQIDKTLLEESKKKMKELEKQEQEKAKKEEKKSKKNKKKTSSTQ